MSPERYTTQSNDEASIRAYLDSIGGYEVLTAEEEVGLAKQIEAGRKASVLLEDMERRGVTLEPEAYDEFLGLVVTGQTARQTFVNHNLKLVASIAKRYNGQGVDFLDLVQEGSFGLIRAVEKFEYRKGFKFSTYATWWIRQAITRSVADKSGTIRVPLHMVDTINTVNRTKANLWQLLGREPTQEEIAEEAGLSVSKIEQAAAIPVASLSIFEPVGQDDATIGDFVEDKNADNPEDVAIEAIGGDTLNVSLADAFATASLNDIERQILIMRFGLDGGEPARLQEIGKKFHLTRERIRQIETRALNKLRPSYGVPVVPTSPRKKVVLDEQLTA